MKTIKLNSDNCGFEVRIECTNVPTLDGPKIIILKPSKLHCWNIPKTEMIYVEYDDLKSGNKYGGDGYFNGSEIEISGGMTLLNPTEYDLYGRVMGVKPEPVEWISVNERLPEKNIDVLCYMKYADKMQVGRVVDFDITGKDDKVKKFLSQWWMPRDYECVYSSVTHWQPLPNTPEDEED